MQDDLAESEIHIMAMCPPAAGTKIYFHIPRLRRCPVKLQDCVPKIRTSFQIVKPRMKNLYRPTVKRFKLLP